MRTLSTQDEADALLLSRRISIEGSPRRSYESLVGRKRAKAAANKKVAAREMPAARTTAAFDITSMERFVTPVGRTVQALLLRNGMPECRRYS